MNEMADARGADPQLRSLLESLATLIRDARARAVRATDVIQVRTCWQIGRHIVEFEKRCASRAVYGQRLLPELARALTIEFGKGFDVSNLRYMRLFYQAFPNYAALRHELSWTHYCTLLWVDGDAARQWYMREAATQHWSTRALDRQVGALYYERLLASPDHRAAVDAEAGARVADFGTHPREFVRDPVLFELLGLPNSRELEATELEQALMTRLQAFLLELGKGFAFVARQHRLSAENRDFYIDLVFYNYLLKCFVIFDVKRGELTHQAIGQMDMYVRMVDELQRGPNDNPTVGIILCNKKDASVVKYSVLQDDEQRFARKYKLFLPTEEELRAEIERERALLLTRQRNCVNPPP